MGHFEAWDFGTWSSVKVRQEKATICMWDGSSSLLLLSIVMALQNVIVDLRMSNERS